MPKELEALYMTDNRTTVGGLHSFASCRERTLSDLGRVRVLAEKIPAELLRAAQHIIHNILFPDTSYEFFGISDVAGNLRIVLT